ncbi:uncharacterized protein LOC113146930 [Cyclospora cayetanensis]|uniref:Uncharacterized protein LOC113146930 n=1 Tax=Cyclospora cayetanensis TaxID=88456 RepID=A0A6P6RUM4_9EIME|nr:uncharacterized protein LOC113146930 [Cyclospora cayetanensis]
MAVATAPSAASEIRPVIISTGKYGACRGVGAGGVVVMCADAELRLFMGKNPARFFCGATGGGKGPLGLQSQAGNRQTGGHTDTERHAGSNKKKPAPAELAARGAARGNSNSSNSSNSSSNSSSSNSSSSISSKRDIDALFAPLKAAQQQRQQQQKVERERQRQRMLWQQQKKKKHKKGEQQKQQQPPPGVAAAGLRKRTTDGLPIYSLEELKIAVAFAAAAHLSTQNSSIRGGKAH